MYQRDTSIPAQEILPKIYDLPSENPKAGGLPAQFYHNFTGHSRKLCSVFQIR